MEGVGIAQGRNVSAYGLYFNTLTVIPKCGKLTFLSSTTWTGCTPVDNPSDPNNPSQCIASMYSDVTVDVAVFCETIQ